MLYSNQFSITVADYRFLISTDVPDVILSLEDGYEHYITKPQDNYDVQIKVHSKIPDEFRNSVEKFKAPIKLDDKQSPSFWNICEFEGKSLIFTSHPTSQKFPFLAAMFNKEATIWDIYCTPELTEDGKLSLSPWLYPMGPLVWYYVAANHGGIMIHSSGVTDGTNGYLFSGVSGVGKSTMANLWAKKRARVINDDRLILRYNGENIVMYNTPMYYRDQPRKTVLNNIFLISHSTTNWAKPLQGIAAVTRLMAFCIQHNYDKHLVNNQLTNLTTVSQNVSIFEMGFVPDTNVVNFIKNREYQKV